MRLLQAMAGAQHGGAEAFFERLAIGLQRADVVQRVAIRHDRERAALLRAEGIDALELQFGGMLDFGTKPALRRTILEFEPRVVLTWINRATRFCPRGGFVHAARLGGYYDLKYYRHCDHLIGNTHGIVDYIRAGGWPDEKVHYLPNFVNVEKAAPLSRAPFGVPDEAPLALALGRLHVNKGFDVLLAALAKLPDVHVFIAGEGPERDELKKKAVELGVDERAHFLGWRSDISSLLATADFFVCPSRHEPLGNVVIEAWAAGKPVIAAASDGPRELIMAGENGILVPIDDADALAHEMGKVATHKGLREHLVANGREFYETQFTEAWVIGLYKDFFDKVAR